MDADDEFGEPADEVYVDIENDDQAKELLAKEAERLGLTLEQLLDVHRLEGFAPTRESPILAGVMKYFEDKNSSTGLK